MTNVIQALTALLLGLLLVLALSLGATALLLWIILALVLSASAYSWSKK